MRCCTLSVGPMEPLPSSAIRLLARKILNRTEVDAADSVVLVAHTRVLSLLYFGCHTHALVGIRCAAVPPAGRRDGPERELRRCASTQWEDAQTALRTVGEQAQPSAQASEASAMIRLMAGAQRPHWMLQPRQP